MDYPFNALDGKLYVTGCARVLDRRGTGDANLETWDYG